LKEDLKLAAEIVQRRKQEEGHHRRRGGEGGGGGSKIGTSYLERLQESAATHAGMVNKKKEIKIKKLGKK